MADASTPVTVTTREIAQDRVRRALDLIEEAQDRLRVASEMLCPVLGFVREWEATGKAHDQVKRLWHKVNQTDTSRVDLDESAKAALAAGRSV